MATTHHSCGPPESLLALSADLDRAETVEAAVARAIELAEAVFEQPVVTVSGYDSGTDTATTIGSSAPPSIPGNLAPGGIPEAVLERASTRGAEPSPEDIPEATLLTDPREHIETEIFVPVGRDRVLRLGTTDQDGFDETDVKAVEGIAANLETTLARIDRQRRLEPFQRAIDDAADGIAILDGDEYTYVDQSHVEDGRLVCTVRDETERQERRQWWQEFLNRGPLMFIETREADGEAVVDSCNDRFLRRLGYDRDEVEDEPLASLYTEDSTAHLREGGYENALTGEFEMNERTLVDADGDHVHTLLRAAPRRDDTSGTHALFVDISKQKEREKRRTARVALLERVYEVTTDRELSFEDKITGLLEAGREHLDLPYGFLTRIERGDEEGSGTQTIVEAVGSHELLQPGESGPLEQSYCRKTIAQDNIMALTHATEAGWADDLAYETFELETYIGSEVVAGDDLYGTLCFASKTPHERSFDEFERSFIRLVGRWAGYEIDRRNSREQLRQQRERLELALSGTNTGLAEWDLETDAVRWNETLVDIVGRNVNSFEEFEEAVHPDDRERVRRELETSIETGDAWAGEFRVLDDDGETVWLRSRATSVSDNEGEPLRVLATATDISDRKEAKRARQRNERRFESLFDDPGILVGLLDADGRLLDANETSMEYVDATPGELRGEPFPETPWWNHSEELAGDLRDWIQRAADGEYVEYTATHPGPDGSRRDVTGTVRPVTDESGAVQSLLITGRDVTERERQQRELRERQQKLDLVLSNTDTAIAELDLESGRVHHESTLGDRVSELPQTAEAFFDMIHPADRARLQSAFEKMTTSGEPLDTEYRLLNEDGETVWLSTQAVPITNGSGDSTAEVVAITTDITELKQRQEALEESQNRYRTLLEAAPDPVFVADAETGELIEVNAAAEEKTGRQSEDLLGTPQTDLHPGEDRDSYQEAFQEGINGQSLTSKLPDGTQPTLCRADDDPVPVEINAEPVELPEGPAIYGVFRDVSERIERTRELELKERAMDEADVGITISDPDRDDNPLIYLNDGFVEQTGYTREETLGRNCRFLQGEQTDPRRVATLRDAIDNEESTTVQLRNYRPDGTEFWNRLSVTPVYDDGGVLTNYIGVQQDVTEEVRGERRLRALHGTTRDLLQADDVDDAVAVAAEVLSTEFGFYRSGVYLREEDELVSKAATNGLSSSQVERVERGRTPLWEAIETGEPVHYEDCADIEDDIDRGETAASAYFPVGDHGVVVAGVTDSDRLGERERRLVDILTGNLAAVLDGLEREASLRASERRYRSLAQNIPNGGVLTFDPDLECTLAAGELISEFGLDASDIVGTTVGRVLPDAADELVPRYRAALEGERTDRRFELRDRTLQIFIVPMDSGTRESDEAGGLVLAQDVTEEARREQELFEERERFRLLTESVDEYAFLVVDDDGSIQTWNGSAETMFGYDADAALGMSIAELHPAADRESGLPDRLLQQARIAGESAHEGWRVRADGSEFYADVRHAPLEANDGEFRGYATIVRDMTERRRQQRRTERFVEQAEDVVTVVDTEGTITYASGSAERVLGYDPDDLVGENLFDYLHPDGREHALKTFYQCVDGEKNVTAECRLTSPDGGWFNVEGRCRNMLDDDAVDGILVYLRDVTEIKERARRFEGIFNQTFQFTGLLEPDGTVVEVNDAALEFGGVERDAIVGDPFFEAAWWTHSEAVYDDVRTAIDRAANGEFVRYEVEVRGGDGLATIDFSLKPVFDEDGDVSLLVAEGRDISNHRQQKQHVSVMQRVMRHNMRNDLTKMRGWTQVMSEETDPQQRADQFETVEAILDKWEAMTEKMAEIRQTLQSQHEQSATTEAALLVDDAVAPVREDYADVTIVTDVSDAESTQVPATLLEAVRELVENAAESTDDARIAVELAGPEEGWLEIAVRDDGPGLPEMEADVLETGEESPLNHGQGLGLWMVRMIVTQVGGDVSVESKTDGTEVCLRLPVEQTAELRG